jgi:hypothetical protein
MKDETFENAFAHLHLIASNGGIASLSADEAQAILNQLRPPAEATPANPTLVTAAHSVIDIYNSDYGIQEVGGDPLEQAMIALSDALLATPQETTDTKPESERAEVFLAVLIVVTLLIFLGSGLITFTTPAPGL